MRLLFIGDIVGSVGRKALKACLPGLKSKYNPTWIIANGENAAAGRGITQAITKELYEMGVHGITMGNHTWDQKEIFDFIDKEERMVRPANFPAGTPGRGIMYIKTKEAELAVINLQGRTFLPPLDCPFEKASELVAQAKKRTKYVFVDFHAEVTSEKLAMGWHLDGKASAVVGTHTHVQTHDERIFPQGTAYVTDVGMVGPRDGIPRHGADRRHEEVHDPAADAVCGGRRQVAFSRGGHRSRSGYGTRPQNSADSQGRRCGNV
ncbi:YmdB [Paenibacillus mucilaginosus 3016]|uniref:YmdB n=1 Tax=Paenibacillus mucilaginosus 3016 TaxID=1116391 RepID=H6NP93_9BACL|nr:YmdB [Paenibacillus mucilaginosus 3016]